MRNAVILTLTLAAAIVALGGCAKKDAPAPAAQAAPAPQTAAPAQPTLAPPAESFTGSVVETMDTGGYTYVQVDTGSERIWGAAPQFPVSVGDRVSVPANMPMANYHSKTLDRTFEVVYFAQTIGPDDSGAAPGAAGASAHPGGPIPPPAAVDFESISKADGGQTVGELLAGGSERAGQEVVVRGKVVKFSAGIMGKNWLHVQDGTGEAGKDDLTVTTDAVAQVGDTVLVRGVASTDKDFGMGYRYALIVEDAQVTVE